MTSSWDFWSVISCMGIFQALLLVITFAANRKYHSPPVIYIVLLLVWIIWLQTEFLVVRRSLVIGVNFFFGTRYGAWFLLGPFVYFYLRSFFNSSVPLKTSWFHYLPFLLFVLILPAAGVITISDRVAGYGMLSVLKFPILIRSWPDLLYGYVFILQFIHAAVYLFMSVRLVTLYQQEHRRTSSDNRQEIVSWLKTLIVTMSVCAVTSVLFIGILLNTRLYVREMDYFYIVPLTVCVYVLSYFTIREPGVFRVKNVAPQRYQHSALEKEDSQRQFEELKKLIVKEKLYLNPELRLSDLAGISGNSYHQLSEVINKEAGVSFFEFVNQFRINEVLSIMSAKKGNDQKVNILEIAFASGFNNKVSFNRYFKKQTGHTPTAFLQKKFREKG